MSRERRGAMGPAQASGVERGEGPPRQSMSRERRGASGVPNAAAALGCLMGPRKRAAWSGVRGPRDKE
jgi:hypothetical protein